MHKRLVGFRDRLKVDLEGGGGWTINGRLTDHEYEIEDEHGRVAEISKNGSGSERPKGSTSRSGKTTGSSSRSRSRWIRSPSSEAS